MSYKCKLGCEKTCEVLNKKLGDCEITDTDTSEVFWRCPNYIKEQPQKQEQKK
jgi:hypothetical protein